MLNKWVYLISIFITIVVLTPYLIEKASAKLVTVNVTDKPFGNDRVMVDAKGPNGYDSGGQWYNWSNVQSSDNPSSGSVSLNLPDSEFPVGANYQICVSSNPLFSLFPNCVMVKNNSNDNTDIVTISLR